MKKLFLVCVCIFVYNQRIAGQSVDLRTGVDVNGNLITTLPATDLWQVAGPYATQGTLPTSGFVPAKITNDYMYWVGGTPPTTQYLPQNPAVPPVAWISKWVTPTNEADYPGNPGFGLYGYFAWKRTFTVPLTCVQSAELNFRLIGVDNNVSGIYINGNSLSISSIPMWYAYNLSFSIPTGYLIPGQQNTIVIETYNIDMWASLKVHGKIDLKYCGTIDMAIRDKDRMEKPEFCLEEDVFLDAMVSGATQYQLTSQNMNTSIVTWSALFTGNPTNINLTNLFHNYYPPGVPIKVTLYVTMPCGVLTIEKTYKFKCCANSANAMFTSVVKNGVLSAQAIGGASHDWKIYTLSPATGQVNNPYPQLDNLERITKTGSYCYLVTHEVNNACGADCKSQRICEKECSASNNPCVPNAPANAQFNNTNWTFSWNPVIGAASYFLEITECDPACCPINDGGPKSAGGCVYPTGTAFFNPTRSKNVFGNTYVLNPADFSWINAPRCFSWRVYAVCENGKRGEPSSNCATTY